jgi:RHS repeat-associated protein
MPPTQQSKTLTLETRSDGLLTAIRRPYGGDTEFDYSATGRVLARREKADGAWVATSFGYDGLDRITSTELANGMRSEIGYDGAGRVRTIASKRSGVVEETLTRTFSAGRLVSSQDSAYSGPETYAYDDAGRVSTITYPGGERREIGYDLRSRVASERFVDAAEATVLELAYVYDLANRVREIRRQPFDLLVIQYTYTNGFVSQTDTLNGLRRTATPDLDFGLTATTTTVNAQAQTVESTSNEFAAALTLRLSTIAGADTGESFWTAYEWRLSGDAQGSFYWDALSNFRRGGPTTQQRELLYNPEANRLLQIRDLEPPNTVRHTYSYDAAGFVTERDGVLFGYDATGAIASIGTVAAFDHDLDGRPISRTLNGVTKTFRFGGAIAYGTAGTPLEADLGEAVIKLDGSSNRYRHLDFRGNVLFQTNASGTVTGHATYRGFGRHATSGNLGERGFAGGFELPSLGLTVLGPRVLDADAGRFLSPDPVFNAVNQYAYAQGNPVFLWDPTGRELSPGQAATVYSVAYGAGVVLGAAVVVAGAPTGVGAVVWGIGVPHFIGLTFAVVADLTIVSVLGGPRMSQDNLNPFGMSVSVDSASAIGGTGAGAGGAHNGVGDPPAVDPECPSPETKRSIEIQACPGGVCIGGSPFQSVGGIYGLNSLSFSIALSFSGAAW